MSFQSLPGGEDWLFFPVAEGWIDARALTDGSVDLAFVALMCDAIAVRHDNEEIARKAQERNR